MHRRGGEAQMARRRYYYDSYEREFASHVTGVRALGARGTAAALEETAFYPASGGQPPDHGALAGVRVVDVFEEDGEIWHLLARGLESRALEPEAPEPEALEPGTRVKGSIDWERRFDHMQQHSGQHILSQAFLRALDAQTTSVHMERTCTLDLATPSLDPEGLERAAHLANGIVMENRPILIDEVRAEDAAALGLRRPPKQTGLIRVVEVREFDRSACGGTHVRATGEVGPILIRGWERYKGGVRVEFLCGWRALRHYREARGLLDDATAKLSTGDADLVAAVTRLQDRVRELERDLDLARRQVLDQEADRLIAGAGDPAGAAGAESAMPRVVAVAFPDRAIEELRMLARALTARPRIVAALAAEPERRLIVARSVDAGVDAAAVLRAALAPFDGRGGGRREVAEGAAPQAPSAQVLVETAAREAAHMLHDARGRDA
jgi:alanyl-tRNA synthetase